jgi:hypothetical protein
MQKKLRNALIQYQRAHQNKWNQLLHYFAFLFAFIAWIFLFIEIKATFFLTFLHYLFSWVGHFCFEKNQPASFKYPWLGFYAGFTWFFMRNFELITGKTVLPKNER